MKKIVCFALSCLLLISLSGCAEGGGSSASGAEGKPLVICVDFANVGGFFDSASETEDLQSLALRLEMAEGLKEAEYQFEVIPASGEERKTTLTRLRTEIMGGGRPDVFILTSGDDAVSSSGCEPLFPFPEKAMKNNLFLKLDDYISWAP